jgi:glycosyltransferase involved in cell wall biosynthesis
MRILHVTDVYRPRVGGIELFVEGLTDRQVAAGHDVTVLTATRDPRPPSRRVPSSATVLRVPADGYVPMATLPVRLSDYDVVHTHLSVVSIFATRVAKAAAKAGVPVVNTVHSMWNGREGWVRIVGAIAGWSRLPQVWTSVSEAAAATIRVVLDDDADVHVVPNAVDVDFWRPSSGARPPRMSPRPVTFVSVMRLAGRKRPLQLVDLLAQVRLEVPSDVGLRALLVGEGPLEGRLRHRIASLGADWVELTGPLTTRQIRALYDDADVFVAPCRQESFGIAALEARAAGVPVVAMRSGGVGEFVRHGVEGLLCDDDHDMADALAGLARDEGLLASMAEHDREHAPVHDWSRTLDGFEAVYAAAGSATRRTARVP